MVSTKKAISFYARNFSTTKSKTQHKTLFVFNQQYADNSLPLVLLGLVLHQLLAGVKHHVTELAGQNVLVANDSFVQHHHKLAHKAALGLAGSRSSS